MTEPNFEGHQPRECGEHRTVGSHRAWCHDCHEWCYPLSLCKGCELPDLRLEIARLRRAREEHQMTDFHAPAGVVIRPGDGLIVCFSADPGMERLNHLLGVLQDAYPGVKFSLLSSVEAVVRYREENEDPT